jgi:hypothetical protein
MIHLPLNCVQRCGGLPSSVVLAIGRHRMGALVDQVP